MQKGPAERGHVKNVKNRQKVSKSLSTLFDNFRAGQKTSKIVKKCQSIFRHFSTNCVRHHFSGPFWGALRELRNIYHHHHPESKKTKSSEANSGSIHPYGRYGNAVKTRKTISTIAILWPVNAIFEKRAATVEVDTLISPESRLVV